MVPLALASPRGRAVLLAAVLGTGMALLDSTVVNVALPALGRASSSRPWPRALRHAVRRRELGVRHRPSSPRSAGPFVTSVAEAAQDAGGRVDAARPAPARGRRLRVRDQPVGRPAGARAAACSAPCRTGRGPSARCSSPARSSARSPRSCWPAVPRRRARSRPSARWSSRTSRTASRSPRTTPTSPTSPSCPTATRCRRAGSRTATPAGRSCWPSALALVSAAGAARHLDRRPPAGCRSRCPALWWLVVGLVAVRRLDAARRAAVGAPRPGRPGRRRGPRRARALRGVLRRAAGAARHRALPRRVPAVQRRDPGGHRAVVGVPHARSCTSPAGSPADDATSFLLTLVLLIQVVAVGGAAWSARARGAVRRPRASCSATLGALGRRRAVRGLVALDGHGRGVRGGHGHRARARRQPGPRPQRCSAGWSPTAGRRRSSRFYELAERGTAWIGTLVFAVVLDATGSYRGALLSLLALFVVRRAAAVRAPTRPRRPRRRSGPERYSSSSRRSGTGWPGRRPAAACGRRCRSRRRSRS